MDLTEFYGFQLSEKLQKLEITSEKILESYINKIKKINPKLNAIVSLKDTSLLFENCKKIDASR